MVRQPVPAARPGPVGLCRRSPAPTLGSALETLTGLFCYQQGSSFLRCVKRKDGLLRLEYQIIAPEIVARRQDAELSLGMFLNVIRECCGPKWAPEEVHFEHPRPQAWKEHEEAFDAPVYFSQPTNALIFRADILERPMPARDPQLLSVMQTLHGAAGPALTGGGRFVRQHPLRHPHAAGRRLSVAGPDRARSAHLARRRAARIVRTTTSPTRSAVETTRRQLAEMCLSSGNCR